MALTSGSKLGPYEILAPLGAGGMGEVYRARDTRLGREVALKILPESFAREPDRLHRFEQEARAVAALNHPNILAIFDTGQESGSPFLVSELLEGETLREVLDGGAFAATQGHRLWGTDCAGAGGGAREGDRASRPEAGEYFRQQRWASQNSGFRAGQAGAIGPGQRQRHAHSFAYGCRSRVWDRQLHGAGTGAGQWRGRAHGYFCVRRGVVRDAFGEARVSPRHYRGNHDRRIERRPGGVDRPRPCGLARAGPDCAALLGKKSGAAVSVGEGFVICAECAFWVGYSSSEDCGGAEPNPGVSLDFGSGGGCGGTAVTWVAAHRSEPKTRMEFSIAVSGEVSHMALSADGSTLAFVSPDENSGIPSIYLQRVGSANATLLPGTEGASYPFWSPDGTNLAFFANGKLMKVAISGGAPVALANVGGRARRKLGQPGSDCLCSGFGKFSVACQHRWQRGHGAE